MSVFETLTLMLAFAALVLQIIDKNRPKK
ncbi:putative holin-like toxin [Enterococcus sp. 5H]